MNFVTFKDIFLMTEPSLQTPHYQRTQPQDFPKRVVPGV